MQEILFLIQVWIMKRLPSNTRARDIWKHLKSRLNAEWTLRRKFRLFSQGGQPAPPLISFKKGEGRGGNSGEGYMRVLRVLHSRTSTGPSRTIYYVMIVLLHGQLLNGPKDICTVQYSGRLPHENGDIVGKPAPRMTRNESRLYFFKTLQISHHNQTRVPIPLHCICSQWTTNAHKDSKLIIRRVFTQSNFYSIEILDV
jgi:hypothetical protein